MCIRDRDRDADGLQALEFAQHGPVIAQGQAQRSQFAARQLDPAVLAGRSGGRPPFAGDLGLRAELRHLGVIARLAVNGDVAGAFRVGQQVVPAAVARFLELADDAELLPDPRLVDPPAHVVDARRSVANGDRPDLLDRNAVAVRPGEDLVGRTGLRPLALGRHRHLECAIDVRAAVGVDRQRGLVGPAMACLLYTSRCV